MLCHPASEAGLLWLVVVVVVAVFALVGLGGGVLSAFFLLGGEGVRVGSLRLVDEDAGRVSSCLADLPCPVASHSCLRFAGFGSVFLTVYFFPSFK
jgi:hypothetical protein